MTLLTKEESALVLADRHIVEALQRIALQEKRVHDQQECGRGSSQSEHICASCGTSSARLRSIGARLRKNLKESDAC